MGIVRASIPQQAISLLFYLKITLQWLPLVYPPISCGQLLFCGFVFTTDFNNYYNYSFAIIVNKMCTLNSTESKFKVILKFSHVNALLFGKQITVTNQTFHAQLHIRYLNMNEIYLNNVKIWNSPL